MAPKLPLNPAFQPKHERQQHLDGCNDVSNVGFGRVVKQSRQTKALVLNQFCYENRMLSHGIKLCALPVETARMPKTTRNILLKINFETGSIPAGACGKNLPPEYNAAYRGAAMTRCIIDTTDDMMATPFDDVGEH